MILVIMHISVSPPPPPPPPPPQLNLSPPLPPPGQDVSVNLNTHLTLKVEGVIEHSGKTSEKSPSYTDRSLCLVYMLTGMVM